MKLSYYIFGSSTTKDRNTTYPKFNPTGIRTHDLRIIIIITFFIHILKRIVHIQTKSTLREKD